ncbi:hypothetical protein ACICHK_05075 [Streptomyces sp. AHU1]|uniref:hypothetical protein n=1 Tax=Streptomyces sp. AHU1 TaxID=3377215 RepID=UPI003877B15B
MTCSPLRAAWWTLALASAVLFPTLCRTSLSVWAARRPGLGGWLRAGRRAGVALAVPLSLAGFAAVVFLVSEGGFPALVPAVLLAPNLATTLLVLGSGASVDFIGTLTVTDTSSSGPGGAGSETAVSLFGLHDLGGWLWGSVLLGVVAAVVLGAGVLREAARPAAVRAPVCFVAGFLLLAVTSGIAVELPSSFGGSSIPAHVFAAVPKTSPTDGGAPAVGPAVLLTATVWAALGGSASRASRTCPGSRPSVSVRAVGPDPRRPPCPRSPLRPSPPVLVPVPVPAVAASVPRTEPVRTAVRRPRAAWATHRRVRPGRRHRHPGDHVVRLPRAARGIGKAGPARRHGRTVTAEGDGAKR